MKLKLEHVTKVVEAVKYNNKTGDCTGPTQQQKSINKSKESVEPTLEQQKPGKVKSRGEKKTLEDKKNRACSHGTVKGLIPHWMPGEKEQVQGQRFLKISWLKTPQTGEKHKSFQQI